jgi:3-oxoacyl-[acyl-carrier-protein] synthase III
MPGPAIVATGSALPAAVRTNDDPIFDWLRAHPPGGADLFAGYVERRVLGPDEALSELMAAAARQALDRAGVAAGDVDLIVGYGSIGTWAMPNDLVTVAVDLGLPTSATILPINNEYANFNQGVVVADALLRCGRAATALVVVGTNWTRHLDYHTPPSISAGDGAGAAVIAAGREGAESAQFAVLDVAVAADRSDYGGMYVAADETRPPIVPPTYGPQVFHLTSAGIDAFRHFGETGPPAVVKQVLARNGLTPADVAFIGHQASAVLNDAWQAALQPAQFLTTLTTYGNMTAANIPVTLDTCCGEIATDHVVLAGLGPEPSCTVLLLGRS